MLIVDGFWLDAGRVDSAEGCQFGCPFPCGVSRKSRRGKAASDAVEFEVPGSDVINAWLREPDWKAESTTIPLAAQRFRVGVGTLVFP
jgi:hypothetical protein